MAGIKKNFIYSALLTSANYVFPLITFPYVTRVLGAENIGLCGFIDSIINYFVLFSMLGMNILGIREIAKAKYDKDLLNKVFSSLFFLNFLTTIVMMIVLFFVTLLVPKLYENYDLMIIGAAKLLFNFLLIEWLYKGIENFRYITVRSIIIKIIYVISVLLLVNRREDYVVFFLLSTLMVVVNAIVNLNYSRRVVRLTCRGLNIKAYVKPFFVLGVYCLLTSMYTTFNVSFLGFVTTDLEVAYYTTASKLYSIFFSIYAAFSGVMLPRMSSLISEGDLYEFRKLIDKSFSFLLFLTVPLVIFSVFNAPGIILLVAGNGYEGAILPMRIIMPMMIIIGFELILIEQVLMPMGKDKVVLTNSVFGALMGILLNILLVPKMGSVGSVIVKNSSEFFVFCLAQYEVFKYLSIKFPLNSFLKKIITYFPLVIIEWYIQRLPLSDIPLMFLSLAICAIYFLIFSCIVINEFNMRTIIISVFKR